MPTWQRTHERKPWGRLVRLRHDTQLGMVTIDAFSVVSYELEDLREPEFDPETVSNMGYIDLDRPALQELLELLQQRIDEYGRSASKAPHRDGESGSS
jgi:hypothetical protein